MKKNLSLLFIFLFLSLCVYAYVGETFTYEGVQYTISSEDDQTGTYQIYVSHYDTATAAIPDVIPYNGQFYQMAGGAPPYYSTTNFIYPQNCSMEHYSKIDYSRVQYPYTWCFFLTSGNVEVDTLILPPNCPQLFISSIGDPDPLAPTGGIHRIFLSGTQQPLNYVTPTMYFYRGGFGLELQEIDLSSYPYTSIPFTFNGCGNLQRVTLPQTVRKFQSELFLGDTSLQELTIPDDLEVIEANAFGNLAFDSLTISDRIQILRYGFATLWYRLRNIFVDPNNPYYTDIDGVLFTKSGRTTRHYPAGRPDTTYVIPSQVDTIGGTTFALQFTYTDSLTNNNGYNYAFLWNHHAPSYQLEAPLHVVRVHTGVSTIAAGAFSYSSIRRLESGEGKEHNEDFSFSRVRIIDASAFAGSLLDSVSLPPSLDSLGGKHRGYWWHETDTFNRSYWFTEYFRQHYPYCAYQTYDSNWIDCIGSNEKWKLEAAFPGLHFTTTANGGVFAYCRNLQSVDFSKSRKLCSIGELTFAHCPALTSLDLSPLDNLAHIPMFLCLNDSALTYVHLPYRVDTIDKGAFSGCVSLDNFVCPAPVPIPIHHGVFEGVNKQTCTLAVPDASIPLYRNAPVWKDFFHIVGNGLTAIAVTSSDVNMGVVRGGAGLHIGDSTVISAIPLEGFEFVSWSDGNTDNPRTVTVTQDSNLVANFRYIDYAINAYPNDSSLGCVTGGGLYHLHDSITLWAHPYEHGKFIEWSDGYKYSLRDWEVTGDTTLVAYFELFGDTTQTDTTVVRYTLTAVANDSTMGFVVGGGLYAAGEEAYLTAVPYDGFRFLSWDFTYRTEESVTFLMTPFDATVTAFFEAVDDALPATPADSSNPSDQDATPYNILGQPVDDTYHGIVIQGGKKRVQ